MKAGPVPGGKVDAEVEASSVVSLPVRIPFQIRAWQKLQENILSLRHEKKASRIRIRQYLYKSGSGSSIIKQKSKKNLDL